MKSEIRYENEIQKYGFSFDFKFDLLYYLYFEN